MPRLRLVRPGTRHRAAFLRSARDHVDNSGDAERAREYVRALADFDAYLAELRHFASHDEPRPGLVRQMNFWLTDGTEILGHLRLRPRLNSRLRMIGGNIGYDVPPAQRGRGYATRMLALGLREAAHEGLDRALLTADAGNVASMIVIERNGGVLDREYAFEGVTRRRYWIDIASRA
jgi:predicted acetyltransferase